MLDITSAALGEATVEQGDGGVFVVMMVLRHGADVLQEIHEDYPYPKREDIEFAKLYTIAYPKVGHPRAPKAADR